MMASVYDQRPAIRHVAIVVSQTRRDVRLHSFTSFRSFRSVTQRHDEIRPVDEGPLAAYRSIVAYIAP
ncbi:hypothetical protein DU500_08265 [Haloplanus rubicundus]|uniref:Uncharacterized protein n=1 Tax=Haloplanus rubicundus TaxID=1547898 RepID=A0A345E2J2_9EURY|nr:hypothetical protein DU500_08265 [Haloplanus rubicundus]AXG09833.1 hypothetical protein DU484_08225 [Haloplanus rubicundus]